MSLHLPKRTAELGLPSLDTQTPIKSNGTQWCKSTEQKELMFFKSLNAANRSSAFKNQMGALPKRTTELPPLEPESDSESENKEPLRVNQAQFDLKHVGCTPDRANRVADEQEIFRPNVQILVPETVLKRTVTTPATLRSNSNNVGVLKVRNSTSRKTSPARLQVVKSFAPPKNHLSARQLFTSDGREILGDSKKSMISINTPFRNLLTATDMDMLERLCISQNNDSQHDSSILDEISSSDESHYSRIFDVSVAAERSFANMYVDKFLKTPDNQHPQGSECDVEIQKKVQDEESFLTSKLSASLTLVQYLGTDIDKDLKKVVVEGNKYVLVRNLGKGGSGLVFEGCTTDQHTSSKRFAIKMVQLHQSSTVREEYMQEIKILKRLSNEDYIVRYFASEIIREHYHDAGYIVMELGETDLYQHLRTRKGDIPLHELGVWIYQMIQALRVIHLNGIIHCDIKPANFIIVNGNLKLGDFGISICMELNKTEIEMAIVAGTCNFLSPESVISVLHNKPAKLSGATDVWSFGIICYYLVYKKLPFDAFVSRDAKLKAIGDPQTVIKFPDLPDYYPEMLCKLTKDCLHYNPALRPTSIQLLTKYPLHIIAPVKPFSYN